VPENNSLRRRLKQENQNVVCLIWDGRLRSRARGNCSPKMKKGPGGPRRGTSKRDSRGRLRLEMSAEAKPFLSAKRVARTNTALPSHSQTRILTNVDLLSPSERANGFKGRGHGQGSPRNEGPPCQGKAFPVPAPRKFTYKTATHRGRTRERTRKVSQSKRPNE